MEQPKPTFSESWHRVAGQRIVLRSAVEIQRQFYRGERWFVVRNVFNNEFFRLRPTAYAFLVRLEGRTVEEAWLQTVAAEPDAAPTQDEAIALLAQLFHANLLRSDLPANATELFDRFKKRRERELRSRLLNLTSIQLPFWDPDPFLRRALPFVRWLFSWAGAALWLAVVGAAGKVAIDHWPALRDQTQGVLHPGNLAPLYLALLFIKTFHELGHAFACRRFGGEVHKLGVMLLFFSPVPFVDATSSWAFRDRWQRIFVAAAGMIAELFVAALATFVWSQTAPGLLHSVAHNVIFIASVTTLLFNLNPLLRYDGYYILSDLLEIPNLSARAAAQMQYLAERHLFGRREVPSPARTAREGAVLAAYGILSWAYRIVLFSGIVLFLAEHWLLLGVLLAAGCFFGWMVRPVWKFAGYLARSPRLARHRQRAVLVSLGGAAACLAVLALVPAPSHFRAPGIVQAERASELFAGVSGYLKKVRVQSGQRVRAGDVLVELFNHELTLGLAGAEAETRACRAALDRAVESRAAEIRALEDRLAALEKRVTHLRGQHELLTLRAPHDGTWASPHLDRMRGSWLARGSALGELLDDAHFEFSAVVPQTEAANLFTRTILRTEVRLLGQASRTLAVDSQRVVPADQKRLPSAALGWRSGGELEISATDPHGLKAQESFFELRGRLVPAPGTPLRHGCSGTIRFTLAPEPLLAQWQRKLRQILQRRFQT